MKCITITKLFILLLLLSNNGLSQNLNVQDSLLKVDIESVTNQIDYMFMADQLHRNYWKYGTFDSGKLDSLNNLTDSELDAYLQINGPDSSTISLIKTQLSLIDSVNTKNLIDLTAKYGFPSNHRLVTIGGKSTLGDAYILLIHSPDCFRGEIRKIAKTAYENGRLKEQSYKHVLWHLNSRKESILKSMNKSVEELERSE